MIAPTKATIPEVGRERFKNDILEIFDERVYKNCESEVSKNLFEYKEWMKREGKKRGK